MNKEIDKAILKEISASSGGGVDEEKKLDTILESLEKQGSDDDLARQKGELENNGLKQSLRHREYEFWIRMSIIVAVTSGAMFSAYKVACGLILFLSGDKLLPKFMNDHPEVFSIMVTGFFFAVFGIFKSLLNGLGKEKNETRLAIEELIKTILTVFKSTK